MDLSASHPTPNLEGQSPDIIPRGREKHEFSLSRSSFCNSMSSRETGRAVIAYFNDGLRDQRHLIDNLLYPVNSQDCSFPDGENDICGRGHKVALAS
ncbi:hypothetical protein CDAR_475631 [Caerostris darwini]|uniref:Uncharacterized protein n=1 Tax=Caerostris darwini TaxID=1538125 RepID=A0AAV4PE59_9ARAC|nr:hypothetical protein CDAR_475631 [Caerostris darwini]